MSIEDLMKPRYKVIADWPFNNYYDVGEIILMKPISNGTYWNGEDSYYLTDNEINNYPHLFKKLEWWEERDVKDMPEYVKIPHYPNFKTDFIVEHVDGEFIKHDFTHIGYFGLKYKNGGGTIYSMFTPATEQEYNEYKSKTIT